MALKDSRTNSFKSARRVLTAVTAGLMLIAAATAAYTQIKPPYDKERLLKVLRLNALTDREVIDAVRTRGVSFQLTALTEAEFRGAGASRELIAAIRASFRSTASNPGPGRPLPPERAPSEVDRIIDRYIQAIGGEAALERLNTRVIRGVFSIPAVNVSGTAEVYAKAPNKSLVSFQVPGVFGFSQGYNGAVAWEQNSQTGLREKTGAELARARRDAVFHTELRLKELYNKMVLSGRQNLGGRDAYVVEATAPDGSLETMYFDSQSGLLVRRDMLTDSPQGKVPAEEYFADFREVDGVKLPFSLSQITPQLTLVIKILEVQHNVPIADARFNKPGGY